MNGFDLSTISDCYVGSSPALAIYLGSTKIWPKDYYSTEYFTVEPLQDGRILEFTQNASSGNLYYSTDKQTWTQFNDYIYVTRGQNVYFKGDFSNPENEPNKIGTFSFGGYVNVSGNIMSLVYGDNYRGQNILPEGIEFRELFKDCTNLINAEDLILPATRMNWYCYQSMFEGCTTLIAAPELPATSLLNSVGNPSVNCYYAMFKNCKSLAKAPELPATVMQYGCYMSMFSGCTSLAKAPELPATTLNTYCYTGMFKGCTSLAKAPELPATTVAPGAYAAMFEGCTLLNEVKCNATQFAYFVINNNVEEVAYTTDPSQTTCINNWLYNVSYNGDFYQNVNTTYPSGSSGIPSNWITHDISHDISQDYLTLEALESGTFTWTDNINNDSIYYSVDDGITWTILTSGSTTPTITAKSKVLLKANLGAGTSSGNGKFSSTKKFNVMGNIMSMVGGDNFSNLVTINNVHQFHALFINCTKLISASNLILPATTLTEGCYQSMFYGCTSLTNAPELPATTLASNCYNSMFYGCTSLTNAPELPATTLTEGCYSLMFYECRALENAPVLPAKTLSTYCYNYMFYYCDKLLKAPTLPTTILVEGCYRDMFEYCVALRYLKCLATDISATKCTQHWVASVMSTGQFVKDSSMSSWTNGVDGIPTGWTVTNT